MSTSARPRRDGAGRPRKVALLGCRVDALTFKETQDRIDALVRAGEPVQHCVVNASKIVQMRDDERLSRIVNGCALVNADGQSVVWAARLLGRDVPERVAGADLFVALLSLAEQRSYGVYFLGATPEVVEATVQRARADHPHLEVRGWRDGYWHIGDPAVPDAVRRAAPDILFVAMPSPRKEYWLADNLIAMGVPFSMGVGGTFDVYAGRVKRAPRWMQRAGLEWLHRFAQEPGRMWRRYLIGNLTFLSLVLRELVTQHRPSTARRR